MAIDRNITININDTSPLVNTAYVDVGKENKVYNKEQVNELVENLIEGTLGSISPSQTLEELNALEDGNYYASEAGDYAFGVIVPVGWQYRFSKIGNVWNVLTKVEMPTYDLFDTQILSEAYAITSFTTDNLGNIKTAVIKYSDSVDGSISNINYDTQNRVTSIVYLKDSVQRTLNITYNNNQIQTSIS